MRICLCSLVITSLILLSCAGTKLTNTWKDAEYRGGALSKMLIIVVAEKEYIRKLVENEFVKQLKARGVDGISSYTIVPSIQDIKKEAIEAAAKEQGADGIIVTRLVGKKQLEAHIPAGTPSIVSVTSYGSDWFPFYSESYVYVRTIQPVTDKEAVSLDTNVYQTMNGKLVWSATSETVIEKKIRETTRSYVETILQHLASDKVIR